MNTTSNYRAGRNATVHAPNVYRGETLGTKCGAEDTARGHARLYPTTDDVTCKRCAKSKGA